MVEAHRNMLTAIRSRSSPRRSARQTISAYSGFSVGKILVKAVADGLIGIRFGRVGEGCGVALVHDDLPSTAHDPHPLPIGDRAGEDAR
jgi:hypothetical protein